MLLASSWTFVFFSAAVSGRCITFFFLFAFFLNAPDKRRRGENEGNSSTLRQIYRNVAPHFGSMRRYFQIWSFLFGGARSPKVEKRYTRLFSFYSRTLTQDSRKRGTLVRADPMQADPMDRELPGRRRRRNARPTSNSPPPPSSPSCRR